MVFLSKKTRCICGNGEVFARCALHNVLLLRQIRCYKADLPQNGGIQNNSNRFSPDNGTLVGLSAAAKAGAESQSVFMVVKNYALLNELLTNRMSLQFHAPSNPGFLRCAITMNSCAFRMQISSKMGSGEPFQTSSSSSACGKIGGHSLS